MSFGIIAVGRAVVTTPGVPPERVQYLRAVFEKVLNDKELLAISEKLKRPIDYLPGQAIEKMAIEILNMKKSEFDELKRILEEHAMK